MEDIKAHLQQAFGESSDDDDEEKVGNNDQIVWTAIKEINGLWLCHHFLSPPQQSMLLSAILNEGWFTDKSNNQAMRFGDLPCWAIELSNSIRKAVVLSQESDECGDQCVLPSDLLWREPLFDQLIVNSYQPGEGICAHVDLLRFEDGIAIVSLESSCVMHFSQVREDPSTLLKVGVHLNPGSLVILSGESRYLWKHEINRKPGFQIWEGQELNQTTRLSITLRKLCTVD
ncbi:2-oxoglutarate (2OG) and Fe(II)-dependent oxygenase superfamily protein [Euphorbia peplus]|nr:2-oxoglutarate (2OG) and Fe(II)-dependent oxygenase superfamily protein [Euphorbia peplus]